MPTYANIRSDLEGAFDSWTHTTVVPANYQGEVTATEFIRVNILPGTSFNQPAGTSGTQGMVRIDIFVEAGYGIARAFAICDLLDSVIASRQFSNGTQTFASTASPQGLDADDYGFYRVNYSVPYRHFT